MSENIKIVREHFNKIILESKFYKDKVIKDAFERMVNVLAQIMDHIEKEGESFHFPELVIYRRSVDLVWKENWCGYTFVLSVFGDKKDYPYIRISEYVLRDKSGDFNRHGFVFSLDDSNPAMIESVANGLIKKYYNPLPEYWKHP